MHKIFTVAFILFSVIFPYCIRYIISLKFTLFTICIFTISCRDWNNPLENNISPIAEAKALDDELNLPINSTTLIGKNSKDEDGNVVSFEWKQVEGPINGAKLNTPTADTSKVTFSESGNYTFELIVTDNVDSKGSTTVDIIVSEAFVELVEVKGGEFIMGSPDSCEICFVRESPPRNVTIDDFYIGKFEVTQQEWRNIMGGNPSTHQGCNHCPVETVSWNQVQIFLDSLNAKMGTLRNFEFRLPTEAEWEYAALGGLNSSNHTYPGGNMIDVLAWYGLNSNEEPQEVGQKNPNELGIHDMAGNVWEWCYDWFSTTYYSKNININPTGPVSGDTDSDKVVRGGSFIISVAERSLRTRSRSFASFTNGSPYIGFRVVWASKIIN